MTTSLTEENKAFHYQYLEIMMINLILRVTPVILLNCRRGTVVLQLLPAIHSPSKLKIDVSESIPHSDVTLHSMYGKGKIAAV